MGMVEDKKWTVHILNRMYTRFGDLNCKTREQNFCTTLPEKLCWKFFGVSPQLVECASYSLSKTTMYNLLLPRLGVVLLEIIFPLLCFNENDQAIWEEDPHEYVRKGYSESHIL